MTDLDDSLDDDAPTGEDCRRGKARDTILARRKFFIASAIAGVAMSACDSQPKVCLEFQEVDRSGRTDGPGEASPSAPVRPTSSLEPRVCLDVAPPPSVEPSSASSASSSSSADSSKPATPPKSASAQPPPEPRPRVCLRRAAPPSNPVPPKPRLELNPQVCLFIDADD